MFTGLIDQFARGLILFGVILGIALVGLIALLVWLLSHITVGWV